MVMTEQWWELGLIVHGEYVATTRTRSRRKRDQWLTGNVTILGARMDHQTYAREVWSVGGKFDGEVYAAGEPEIG